MLIARQTTVPFHMSSLAKSDNDFFKNGSSPNSFPSDARNYGNGASNGLSRVTLLPPADIIPEGQIPINKDQQRLDPYIPQLSSSDYDTFKARTSVKKFCNNYHVCGSCSAGDSCPYG
jgi:hypothetical protein